MFPHLFVVHLNGLRQILKQIEKAMLLKNTFRLMSTLEMLHIGRTLFTSNFEGCTTVPPGKSKSI